MKLDGAKQEGLIVSPIGEPELTVDNLEIAQFVYVLLDNPRVRNVIDTITSKVVLILGRFTPERKPVLDAVRSELRRRDLCPIMFDFEKPGNRSFIETVTTLAHMAKFVIADFSDAKIVLQELPAIVGSVALPVAPIMHSNAGEEPVTLADVRRGRTFILSTRRYADVSNLIEQLPAIVNEADDKAKELARS